MKFLTTIQTYIDNLDKKEFRNYLLIFFSVLILLLGLILFQYHRSVNSLKSRMTTINKTRSKVRDLVTRYELVKKQQVEVNAILAKEKDFKINQYFEQLLSKLHLTSYKTQDVETVSEEVLDGYTEWTLYAQLNGINTRQMAELLHAIELEERLYTKALEIEQAPQGRTINIKLTIATLEPKAEVAVTSEQ